MIEFNFTRRQSDVSLNVELDCNANNIQSIKQGTKTVKRSNTFTPREFTSIKHTPKPIVLPERFRWKVRRRSLASINLSNMSGLENIDEEQAFDFSQRWDDKKRDMEQALQWIRQELRNLKKQDKILRKRLLDLEGNVQQLRGIHSCPSLAQSRSSIVSGASYLSLEDSLSANQNDPSYQQDNILAFRARMVAEFQKSKPNLNVQAKAISLFNIQNTDMEPKPYHAYSGSMSSCSSSGVIYVSNSSHSGEVDFQTPVSPDHSRSSSSYDIEDHFIDTINNTDPSDHNNEEDNDTLKWRQKINDLMPDISSSSSEVDEESNLPVDENSTLTRVEDSNEKAIADSLEDILTAASTQEEREGVDNDETDEIEYMV